MSPGLSLIDIVVESAAVRLRPIVLTTIATVIGMVPLAYANATWGPLAFAIILTLVLVPTLFYRRQVKLAECQK